MPTLAFYSTWHDPAEWERELKKHIPDLDFRVYPDRIGNPDEVEFALIWGKEPGWARTFRRLKGILAFGAGVDHLLRDPDLPRDVPVARGVAAGMVENMSQYVAHWVVHFHRNFHLYRDQQAAKTWKYLRPPPTAERRVGILGLGELGSDAARKIAAHGFPVAGWSRRRKALDGVKSYAGDGELAAFLGGTDILVCLLPLTQATTGILNARTLAQMPKGAFVINPGRGRHVVDADLLAALDSGHLAGAALDVFHTEPLPTDHPFWTHPKVFVTPHAASWNDVASAAAHQADNIKRILRGEKPRLLVDRAAGY